MTLGLGQDSDAGTGKRQTLAACTRYLNMEVLREHKKEQLRLTEAAG